MGQITVFSGPERRRRWSDEQRLQLLTEAFASGACASDVARRHEISTGLLYTWRKKLAAQAALGGRRPALGTGFAEAIVVADPDAPRPRSGLALVVELGRGRRMIHLSRRVGGPRGGGAEGVAVIPPGAGVWIAMGHTDMRKGMQGLALIVQQALRRDPFAGDLYVFRGRAGSLLKIVWHDGIGMSLYAKRLEKGRFIWPSATDGMSCR